VSQDLRLGLVLAINLTMVAALLVVGLIAHSLGVLAAGADYLGDALGAGLSLAALHLSTPPARASRPSPCAGRRLIKSH
jgi:Co/Zn/Cd efflux system component